ncbi:MAG: dTDP-4-dehydrorhamnose 3,5-epimerase [Hyphomicrobiales bacterium]
MIFRPMPLVGAYCISLERREDARGFFARSFCETEFAAHGLKTHWAQANVSYNVRKGTLRGLHFQRPPHAEVKLVKCLSGAVLDVLVDLRAGSPSFGHWTGVELTSGNRDMAYVPEGFAHGYQTLTEDAEVMYLVSAAYAPQAEGGLNALDPALGIQWPLPVSEISPKDSQSPALSQVAAMDVTQPD